MSLNDRYPLELFEPSIQLAKPANHSSTLDTLFQVLRDYLSRLRAGFIVCVALQGAFSGMPCQWFVTAGVDAAGWNLSSILIVAMHILLSTHITAI